MASQKHATVESLGTLAAIDGAVVAALLPVNHRPHPYMIGTRHVTHAAQRTGGMLDEATLRAVPCAQRGCRAAYEDHTYDLVAVVALARDMPNAAIRAWLQGIADHVAQAGERLDGFVFLDTGFKVLA